MPKPEKELNPAPKPSKGIYLAEVSIKEIKELLKNYENEQRIELSEHLMSIFGNIDEYFKTKDKEILSDYRNADFELVIKYGRKFKPFHDKGFHKLFSFETVLLEKGYYTEQEFKLLENQEKELSQSDVTQWIVGVLKFLHAVRYYTHMDGEPEFETTKIPELKETKEEHDGEMTEARQLLAIYFIFKAGFGIEPRHTHDISKVARFAHLMSRRRITSMQNSSIYEKLKTMPYYKKDESLIEDLKYIKPFFKELDMQKALELIDDEQEKAIQGLSPSKRNKYRAE